MKNKPFSTTWLSLGMICILTTNILCKSGSSEYEPTYSSDTTTKKNLLFGVPNLSFYDSAELFVAYLNENLKGIQVQAVPSNNVAQFDDKLQNRYFDFSIGGGVQVVRSAGNGYYVIAASVNAMGNGGVILVNKDSLVNSFSDLRGKTIVTVGPPALPGHMLQLLYLSKNGINVKKDIRFIHVQSFESVCLNLYLGKSAVGFMSLSGWNNLKKLRPEFASRLLVKWEMPGLINSAILFRSDLANDLASQIQKLVLTMHNSETGKNALARLGYLRFDAADSSDFKPVKNFLEEYQALEVNEKN